MRALRISRVARLLSAHNVKEERVLYPAAERILESLGQREEVLRCMHAETAIAGADE
jgi:hemerythrin superfamily protein